MSLIALFVDVDDFCQSFQIWPASVFFFII